MKKSKKKTEVYTISEYVIAADELNRGWLMVYNRKTNFKFTVFVGEAGYVKIVGEQPERLLRYLMSVEWLSLSGLNDDELVAKVVERCEVVTSEVPEPQEEDEDMILDRIKLEETLKEVME